MDRKSLKKWMEESEADFEKISDQIWDYAETCYTETKSMQEQASYLASRGFIVTAPAYDIPTAMVAEYGSGNPVIAFLGEYDALDALSQEADVPECRPLAGNGKGHGCGHNLLGTAAVEAACAVQKYIDEKKLDGTVRYYGCPAEEGGAGKIYMLRRGAFEDVDIAISWHPAARTAMMSECLSTLAARFCFRGLAAHAAAAPEKGRSALDAAELMNTGVQYLREHIPDGSRIHYAFQDVGGTRPNIVQSSAALYYVTRAKDNATVKEIFDRVVKVAQGAALMTETELLPIEITNAYSNILPNDALMELLQKETEGIYPITYTEEEEGYARAYNKVINGCEEGYDSEFHKGRASFGSTDFGDVSWVIPSVAFAGTTVASQTAGHSWAMTGQGKSSGAHKGMHAAAKLMATVAIRLMEDPEEVKKAKDAFQKELLGRTYKSLLPQDAVPRILF